MNHKNKCRPAAQRPVETVLDGGALNDLKPCPFCLSNFIEVDLNSCNAFCVFCIDCNCVGSTAPTAELAKEYWNYREQDNFKAIKERDFYLW